MQAFQFRLKALAYLVAVVALACGWAVALREGGAVSSRPSRRIVAEVLAGRAARPVVSPATGQDLALPALVVLGALAASRARRRLGPRSLRQRPSPAGPERSI